MANEDKASRYHRLRRQASVLGTAGAALAMLVFLVSGSATVLRDVVEGAAGHHIMPSVALYVALLVVAAEVAALPVGYYLGVTLEKRYGLGTQRVAGWLADRAKATLLTMILATVAALVIVVLLRWTPQYWWLLATGVFAGLLTLLARIAPVALMPLFYRCTPIERPALTARLLAVADRAGVPALGVFEWHLGDRTRKANAALAGLGATRRILVSDTLLAHHSDDEIEVVLAHELAHHVHGDIWTALVVEALVLGVGLFAADRVLAATGTWLGFSGMGDIAALPLIALTAGAVSVALLPLSNALSRAHERRADRYALDITGNPTAFVSAMRRLAVQNMAEEQPGRLVQWLFHSHPPAAARIAAASVWRPQSPTLP